MPRNHARSASDGRLARNRRVREHAADCAIWHTNGTAVVKLVKNELPRLRVVEKPLTLIPGVLVVGAHSPLMGGYSVTSNGEQKWMSLERINLELVWACAAREVKRQLERKTPPTKKAESVPLLTAWCATSKPSTMPILAAVA